MDMTDDDHENTWLYWFSIKTQILLVIAVDADAAALLKYSKFFQWKSLFFYVAAVVVVVVVLFFVWSHVLLFPFFIVFDSIRPKLIHTQKMMNDCMKTMWNDIAPSEICVFWISCEGTSKINEPRKIERFDSIRFLSFHRVFSPLYSCIVFMFFSQIDFCGVLFYEQSRNRTVDLKI